MAGVLLGTDQLSKWLAYETEPRRFVDPVLNDRLALGMGEGSSIALITVVPAMVGVGWLILINRSRVAHQQLLTAAFAAGLVGNWLDRVRIGAVRDWLVIGPTRWNLADIWLLASIVLGAAFLMRQELQEPVEG